MNTSDDSIKYSPHRIQSSAVEPNNTTPQEDDKSKSAHALLTEEQLRQLLHVLFPG